MIYPFLTIFFSEFIFIFVFDQFVSSNNQRNLNSSSNIFSDLNFSKVLLIDQCMEESFYDAFNCPIWEFVLLLVQW